MACKRTRFGLQKDSFYNSKGPLLQAKRTTFEIAYYNGLDFMPLQPFDAHYIYSPKSVSRMSPFFVRVSWKANAARRAQGSCPCDAMR